MRGYFFDGKVCAVTGAGSGIGRALACNLAHRGATLALSDVDLDGLAETAEQCRTTGAEVLSDRLDVAEREAVIAYADDVARHFGRVNQIYNNAGVAFYGTVEQSEFTDIERVMNVDYWGVVHGTMTFLPHLIASGDGHVVNISSLFGIMAISGHSAYNSAKFAVRGFTEALRQEMLIARRPVKVTCIHPGGIKTSVARNSEVAKGINHNEVDRLFDKWMGLHTPDMAAKTILEGVTKGRARVLIGWEAKTIDAVVRFTGSGHQRIAALAMGILGPK